MRKSYRERVKDKLIANHLGPAIVSLIADAMFPGGNTDHEWGADTLDRIADILNDNKLVPEDLE